MPDQPTPTTGAAPCNAPECGGRTGCFVPWCRCSHHDERAAAAVPSPETAPAEGLSDPLTFARTHRANYVTEPRGDYPIWTRVKCDGDDCDFYAEADRWYDAMAKHDAHVADLLAAREVAVAARVRAEADARVERVRALLYVADDPTLARWPQFIVDEIERALGDDT